MINNYVCNKIPYPSRKVAKREMKHINAAHNSDGLKTVYYCEEHKAWHTTSKSKKKSKKIANHLKIMKCKQI